MRYIVGIMLLIQLTSNFAYCQDKPGGFHFTADEKVLLTQKLDAQWARMFEPELKKGSSLIDVSMFALNAVSVDYPMDRIETALNDLKKNINRSASNPKTYGNIFWYAGDTVINDTNGVEFCMRPAVLIWILYHDKLSPAAQTTLQEIFNLSIEGVKRHNVKLSYTNIILMKTANLILLGEYDNQPELAKTGYALFKDWIAYTYKNGICEYLSPTYYTVDIENLALIDHLTKIPEIRQIAATALDYLWTDIALNWYQPSQRLGGTHSRDYDRLCGHNSLDLLVNRAGWNDSDEQKLSDNTVFAFYTFVKPDDAVKTYLTNPLPRYVYQRWGEASYQRASNYCGVHFSVGSAESNYFNMDKTPLVINLGSGYQTPVINFFMDGREDYYGFKQILEKSGHMKSLHLMPFITSVQNDGEVLFLASAKDDADKLESIITLPADAELWLNDQKLNVFHARSAWQINPAANKTTTGLQITNVGAKPLVQLTDHDKNVGIGIQQKFKVSPQKYYRLKASMKGQGISLYINFFDQNSHLIQMEHIKNISLKKDAYNWNEITEQAPERAVYCIAWIYSTQSNVTDVTINDLRFEELINDSSTKLLGSFDFAEEIPQQLTISEDTNLFIKREDVVTVLRLLKALDVSGKPIPLQLSNDGLKYGAMRLTATHSSSKTGNRGSIAVWSYTAEGINDDQKFTAFRNHVMAVKSNVKLDRDRFDINVGGITGEMELVADVAAEDRISRRGMKPGPENSLLSVNGIEVGRKILERLDVINKGRK